MRPFLEREPDGELPERTARRASGARTGRRAGPPPAGRSRIRGASPAPQARPVTGRRLGPATKAAGPGQKREVYALLPGLVPSAGLLADPCQRSVTSRWAPAFAEAMTPPSLPSR